MTQATINRIINQHEITMESFGSMCPSNWREIAAYLNEYIADQLAELDDDTPDYEIDALMDRIWEDYCGGNLTGCPADVLEPTMRSISIDNGHSTTTPEEALKVFDLETLAHYMDDDAREQVAREFVDSDLEFLTRYLEIAPCDLVIG